MGSPSFNAKVLPVIGTAHATQAAHGAPAPVPSLPQVAPKQPDGSTLLTASNDPGDPAGLAQQPHFTAATGIDCTLPDNSSNSSLSSLERLWETYEKGCAAMPSDDESRTARLKELKGKVEQEAKALGEQYAQQFGDIEFDLRDFQYGSEDAPGFMFDAFLDGLAASPSLSSIRLRLRAGTDETDHALIRLLNGLEGRAGANPLPLVCELRGKPGLKVSDGYVGYVKTLERIFSSPTLSPREANLYLANKATVPMPALAHAQGLTRMALRFESEDFIDALPLKGHENCWPNLQSLTLQSNERDPTMQAMDWAAFMKAHPALRDLSLVSVQAPLAQLLRAKLSVNGPLPPDNLAGLADALAATNSLHELWVSSGNIPDPSELLRGLALNKSIETLYLNIEAGDAEAWAETIRGLKDHPRLILLSLRIAPGDKNIEAACAALSMARPDLIVNVHQR